MTEAPSVHVALAAVKKAVGAVGKDQRNTAQNFNFRGVDAVVNAAAPHLNEHGVIVLPEVLDYSTETVEVGRNKTPMAHVSGKVKYHFAGPAGDEVCAVVVSEAMDSGDKTMPKFMSVAYRIALLQVLNLPTDEPDPDASAYERSSRELDASPAPRGGRAARKEQPPAKPGNAQDLAQRAKNADSVDELRAIWKQAGEEGHLQSEITVPLDGGEKGTEKLQLQDYLQRRNDELRLPKSAGVAEGDPGAAGGAQ
jgi:hypothetical protein